MNDSDIDKQIAQLTQAAEQMGAAMRDVAAMMGAFRKGLIDNGFPEDELIPMCVTQLGLLWHTLISNSGSED